ncbi:MAG: hypothetical protein LBP70_00315 [Mycoplasmataceae bacterium]|nr:hypothetical protein [Mycoplasmataceae bacterium]
MSLSLIFQQEQTKEFHKTYKFRKATIVFSLFLGLLCCLWIFIGILGQWDIIHSLEIQSINSNNQLTVYGIIALIINGLTFIGSFFSVLFTLLMKPFQKVKEDANKIKK